MLVGGGKRGARVLRRIGRPERARDVLEGLMLDRGLRRSFPRAATAEAEAALHEPYAADARVDLRELPTFTIDPDDAQGLRRRRSPPGARATACAYGCTSRT